MTAVGWLLRRRLDLVAASAAIMIAAPYLGALPVRTIPDVVGLAAAGRPPGGELGWLLGGRAGELPLVLAVLVGAGALSFALALLNTRVGAALSAHTAADLRLRLHEVLLARPPAALRAANQANLTRTALLEQSRVVAMYAANTLPAAFGTAVALAVWGQTLASAVATPGRPWLAGAVVGGVVAVLLGINAAALWLAGRRSQASQREVLAAQAAFAGLSSESIDELAELQLNLAEPTQQARLRAVLERMAAAEVRLASWSGLAAATSGGVVLLGIPLLVMAWQALGLEGAQLAVMIPALLMLQRSVASAGSLWTSRRVAQPAIELCEQLLAAAPPAAAGAPLVEATGRLELDGVAFSAGGRDILRGLSLIIAPGETVALVGRGGCGKSTVLRLLVRLAEPTGGALRLDGRDVATLALPDLRRRVGLLDQHPAFFQRSLRENLLLDGAPRDDARIRAAARAAHALEIIDQLGLDHALPARGGALSGSERRRLALTRLLLREPDVILLDELEAGLPQALAQEVMRDLRAATAGKTCLFVTHRPDLLPSDRVAFVHEGSILRVGTHEELERDCAPYRSLLAEAQQGSDA